MTVIPNARVYELPQPINNWFSKTKPNCLQPTQWTHISTSQGSRVNGPPTSLHGEETPRNVEGQRHARPYLQTPRDARPCPVTPPSVAHNLSCPAIPSVLSICTRKPARPLRLSLNFCVIAGIQKQPSVCVSMRARAWAQMSRSGAVSMRLLWTQQGNASEAWPTQWLPSEWMEFKMATLTSWACRRETIPLSFFPLALSHSGFSLFFHPILSARQSPMRHFRCDGDPSGVLWCARIPGFTLADYYGEAFRCVLNHRAGL